MDQRSVVVSNPVSAQYLYMETISSAVAATEPGNVLCVANFRTNTGYAWDFIESLYASIADDLARFGVRTWVAYPRIDEPPSSLSGSCAEPLELKFDLSSPTGILKVVAALRSRRIRTIYLTDRATWHPAYAILRLAGVRTIVVHDHTSGDRTPPTGLKRVLKQWTRRFKPALADAILAVSEYVRRRKIEVDLAPAERVHVMLNSVEVPTTVDRDRLRRLFGVPPDRPIVLCACRAAEYKGVQYLLEAFDRLVPRLPVRPLLIYFGDGPYMSELRRLRETLEHRDDVIFAGYRPDVPDLIGGADLCVVPSVWGEAFGLAALEPAANGVAVVASRVGGIPEVVVDGETGRLVPPASPDALCEAMEQLLTDEETRRAMGARGRQRAVEIFSRRHQVDHLTRLFRQQMELEESMDVPMRI
jgi:glycosyltransferase involved in cell wall biosynthesis